MIVELLDLVVANWPTVGLVASLLVGIYLLARYWAAADLKDMRRRVDYLDERVEALSYQVECYLAYWLVDSDWHLRQEFLAREKGWALEPHVSFLAFRERWMKEHGYTKELEIWKAV